MNPQGAKYDFKRMKISFATVVALTVLAGIIQLALVALTPNASGDAPGAASPARAAEAAEAASDAGNADAISALSAEIATTVRNKKAADPESAAGQGESAESKRRSKRAAALRGLVLDGKAISADKADALAEKERSFTKHVEFIDQDEVLPAGCEIVALGVALRSMGHDVDPQDLADNYVDMSGSFPKGYTGSPYENGGGMPPCIANAAAKWLDEHAKAKNAKGFHARDTTGSTFDALVALVKQGYPVLVWTTEDMVQPSSVVKYGKYVWYWPEHCVIAYGIEKKRVLVCDSIIGKVKYDRAEFADNYTACGSMSVAILPV